MTDCARRPVQGKIIRGIAGFYYVDTAQGRVYACRAKGIFRRQQIKPLVGDDVEFEITHAQDGEGNITRILPRRNALYRPSVANVDQALVLFAVADPAPSCYLLDKYLVMLRFLQLPALIGFNKSELASQEARAALADAYRGCGARLFFISARRNEGTEALKEALRGRTTVLAGPSGVGKSTLLNLLHPEAAMETGELSRKIARGKNTTRRSELFRIRALSDAAKNTADKPEETYLVDTPGFTALELPDIDTASIRQCYPEFLPYEKDCRFSGCAHLTEPDCGVKRALSEGRISRVRYDNYAALCEEHRQRKPIYRRV